jgi:hypothetical protein
MKNLFEKNHVDEVIGRINQLSPDTKPLWGTMNAAQMLAHTSVTYEYVYENKYDKPKGIKKFLLKTFLKPYVVGDKPYKKNVRTAPDFLKTSDHDFELEKKKLIEYLNRTQELGGSHFDGKDSHSFGPLTEKEWNTMFYKHLDHHLSQFGV